MSYEIQKNVPIETRAKAGPSDWPLLKMDVGDSFLIPISEYSPGRVHAVLGTVRLRNHGWAWTARLVKRERGMRIWCIQRPDSANTEARNAATKTNQPTTPDE